MALFGSLFGSEGGSVGGGGISGGGSTGSANASGYFQGIGTRRFAAVTEANTPGSGIIRPSLLPEEEKLRARLGLGMGDVVARQTPFDEAATGPGGLGLARGLDPEFIERNAATVEAIQEPGPEVAVPTEPLRPNLFGKHGAVTGVAQSVDQALGGVPGDILRDIAADPLNAKSTIRNRVLGGAIDALPDVIGGPVSDVIGARTGSQAPQSGVLPDPVNRALDVVGDISAIKQGTALPSDVRRGPGIDPSGTSIITGGGVTGPNAPPAPVDDRNAFEKGLSVVGDISSAIRGRGIASRQAGIQQERLRQNADLNQQRQRAIELEAVIKGYPIYKDALDSVYRLPADQRDAGFDQIGDLFGEQFGEEFGTFAEIEKRAAGSTADSAEEMAEFSPKFDSLLRSVGPLGALEAAAKNDEIIEEVQQGKDRQRFPAIQRMIQGQLEYAAQNGIEIDVNQDGFKSEAEVIAFNDKMPEGANGLKMTPQMLGTVGRNANAFPGYVDEQSFVGTQKEKRAEMRTELKKSRELAKQKRKDREAELPLAEREALAKKRGALEAERGTFETFSDPDTGLRIQRNTITGEEKQAPTQKGLPVVLPDGTETLSFDGGRTILSPTGGQFIPIESVPGARVITSGGATAAGPAKTQVKHIESARDAAVALARTTAFLGKVNSAVSQGARPFGPFAAVSQDISGVLGVFGPAAEDIASQALSGMAPGEFDALKLQASALAAQTIPVVTGEEGARKTEYEQRLADAKSRLNSPTATIRQARGAVQAIMGLHMAKLDGETIRAGLETEFDTSTEEGALALLVKLDAMGFDPQMAADTAATIVLQREWLEKTGLEVKIRGKSQPASE